MAPNQVTRILTIAGSLRAKSSNAALLQAVAIVAPPNVRVMAYDALGALPHFNPDLDGEVAPPAVHNFRSQIAAADGLLISSPEYAHGVPGVLKNALDWLVSYPEFDGKPIALLSASPRGSYAQAALVEILTTMSATLVTEAFVSVPLLGRAFDAGTIAADPEISAALRSTISKLVAAIAFRTAMTLE